MKKIQFGKSKWYNKLSGKGFYIALTLCVAAVGVASYIAVNRTISNINGNDILQNSYSIPESFTSQQDRNVDNKQEDVPVLSPENSASSAKSKTSKKPKPAEPKKIEFAMPITGDILNHHSNGELVKSKTLGDWRTHDGIDIKAELDTPVKAAADGTVIEIKDDKKWGICVIIDHGQGHEGHYYNLNATVNVETNQKLKIGDVIGSVGKTAENEIAEEPHLHFGMKKDDKWIDFLKLIKE